MDAGQPRWAWSPLRSPVSLSVVHNESQLASLDPVWLHSDLTDPGNVSEKAELVQVKQEQVNSVRGTSGCQGWEWVNG